MLRKFRTAELPSPACQAESKSEAFPGRFINRHSDEKSRYTQLRICINTQNVPKRLRAEALDRRNVIRENTGWPAILQKIKQASGEISLVVENASWFF